ncbi:hypothetical protein ACFSSC_05275 [Corynebacterium mendelii]|uniref:SWIM-type domain-containing protein n=1 Tax=Corynebacterium mendelii TaxID=2765362 RepID=A0A939IWA1_9CORY|nr:hypothetical protein [Corynebacterium mendelii]MBN9643190.1 hypothetical protein [Corynebacterium mendelii]
MSTLPPIDPGYAGELLSGLPRRLSTRAGKLAETHSDWAVAAQPGGTTITIGTATVTVTGPDQVVCDCLLSPRCAHCGAVCVAAPPAAGTPEGTEDAASTGRSGGDDGRGGAAGPAPVAAARVNTRQVLDTVDEIERVLQAVIAHGITGTGARGHARLLAVLQKARVAGLHRAERQITAVVSASADLLAARPVGRAATAEAAAELALTAHLLRRDPTDIMAVGRARRQYLPLDTTSGAATGVLTALFAEPVITGSGFAGVVVVCASDEGALLSITKTPPGTAADVPGIFAGPVRLGDMHCSHSDIARATVLITGATASSDGRLGQGAGVHAALGRTTGKDTVTAAVRGLDPACGIGVVAGTLTGASVGGITVDDGGREIVLGIAKPARQLGVAGLAALVNCHLGEPVTALVRDGELVALWPDTPWPDLDDSFKGRIFPGLDQPLPRESTGPPTGGGTAGDGQPAPLKRADSSVGQILDLWCQRLVFGGKSLVDACRQDKDADISRLRALAAPTAAELLEQLAAAADCRVLAAVAAYHLKD